MGEREAGGADPRRVGSRERVIRVLRELGPARRADIARRTALSRTTVSAVLSELQAAGLVVEDLEPGDGPRTGQAGRPPALVRLDRSAGAALGIDFGKRHLRVAVADLGHRVLAERHVPMSPDHPAEQGIDAAVKLVDEVLAEAGIERAGIVGVAMGLPGPINQDSGELGSSTILPGWVGVRAQEVMSERLGVEVHVDNDANLGALAEWTWGAARDYENVAYLKVSTGIGAGLIVAGRPFRGAGGTAGEIGHTIIDPEGPICRCGNRGCLETLVGASALLELLRPAVGPVTLRQVLQRAREGDAACRRAIADAGTAIGVAVASLCNLINPERIVVGGDLGAAGELLLSPMRDALTRAAIPSAAADVDVVAGTLGDRAELLGAIALVLRDTGVVTVGAQPDAEAAA
ncbi:MAG TPA: ROK family protein [Solirubrobacteraceae bacterium]|nr:ROK family protein [Solirubrobacteraceae bacterium]